MSIPNDLIFYHYPFSPYAQRITNYLALRGIEYSQCLQPPMLPRPDLNSLGIQYRRIPLMAIGRDIYADTRLIITELERRIPSNRLASTSPEHAAIEHLLTRYITDAGIFARASQLLPPDLPLMKDAKFQKDREQMTGRAWNGDVMRKGRPEALVHVRDLFDFVEGTLLSDGREWLLNTRTPMLADVEASWVFAWLVSMGEGAIPSSMFGKDKYPMVYAWVMRFQKVVKEKMKKPVSVKGAQAREFVLSKQASGGQSVDEGDPTGLKKGDVVTVFPIDSGSKNKDVGRLVRLDAKEVAVEIEKDGKTVVLHTPRWGFRVEKGGEQAKL